MKVFDYKNAKKEIEEQMLRYHSSKIDYSAGKFDGYNHALGIINDNIKEIDDIFIVKRKLKSRRITKCQTKKNNPNTSVKHVKNA